MSDYYILENDAVKRVPQLEWAKWYETHQSERIVKQTMIDGVKISTVFLGIDHSFLGGPPLIFETMVFGGDQDAEMDRYSTKREALEGHEAMCSLVATASEPEGK